MVLKKLGRSAMMTMLRKMYSKNKAVRIKPRCAIRCSVVSHVLMMVRAATKANSLVTPASSKGRIRAVQTYW